MIDRRSMLSAIISTALLRPSLAIITPAAAQGTNRAERLWTGFSSVVGMAFDKSGNLYAAEWTLGVQLFERRHRGVRLTEAGRGVSAGIGHPTAARA